MHRTIILTLLGVLTSFSAYAEITATHQGAIRVGNAGDACAAGIAGAIRYNGTTIQLCTGSAWTNLSTGSPTVINSFRDARTSYATNYYLYLGAGAGSTSTADYNVGVGQSALGANSTGTRNTALGYEALKLNDIGTDNTAVGAFALTANTTGSYNTAVGGYALTSNNIGSYNTAVGYQALENNTIGEHNTAVGYQALKENIAGSYNTTVGNQALMSNTDGSYNTALGYYSMRNGTTGSYNTGIGHQTLRENEGNYNTAMGTNALSANVLGSYNTSIGVNSMMNEINAGSSNVAFGNGAMENNSGTYNTAIGNGALSRSYTTSSTYNTAIGVLSGPAYNTITNITRANPAVVTYSGADNFTNGAIVYINGVGGMTQVNGNTYVVASVDVAANGLQLSGVNSSGYSAYTAGGEVAVVVSNTTAIGYQTAVLTSNQIRMGNTSMTEIGGPVAWTNPSDRRDKTDIKDIGLGLSFINSLKPVSYHLKTGNGRTDYGFIAQDVKQSLRDYLGDTDANLVEIQADGNQTHMLRYFDLVAPIVKSVQEQQKEIESLTTLSADNQKELDILKAKIEGENE